jgi:Tol biopolymer transport system component
LIDVQRGASTRFTTDPAFDSAPVWSPDGNRIFFVTGRGSGKPGKGIPLKPPTTANRRSVGRPVVGSVSNLVRIPFR